MNRLAVRYNGTINSAINGTTLMISWDEKIKASSVHVYTKFSSAGVAVKKYNEVPSIGYTGFAINDDQYTHTSFVSFGDTNPLNQLTGKFDPEFCANETECEERLDMNNITIWHLPCGEQNQLNINISMGLDFHTGIFAFKDVENVTQWTFDVNSCNELLCTDVGIDSETHFVPALNDKNRAKNATIATCSADNIDATISCINGNWLGVILSPLIVC